MTEIARTLSAVLGNSQRLDGGAMFGNVPRPLWSRWVSPDEQHRIPLACRALLVEETHPDGQTRRILCEAGIGAFFDPKARALYGVLEDRHVLVDNLLRLGVTPEMIDIIVLSHLHFDHAGGLLAPWSESRRNELVFNRARYLVSRQAWARAIAPHPRDRASFIPELQPLIEATGRLELVDDGSATLGPDFRFHFSEGHTPGLMLIEIPAQDGPVVFAGDLVPGRAWVHLPVTMGYDRYPELLVEEKLRLYENLAPRGGRLFFTHDAEVAMGRLVRDERGRWTVGETWPAPVRLTMR